MRKFLQRLSVSAVVLFFMTGLMDYVICRGLLNMEDYRFQDYAAMLRGGMDRDLLIMGNSRGKAHYDPHVLDSLLHTDSFCIGVGGYPFNIQSLKYGLYREHNRKPKVIIQDVDMQAFETLTDIRHHHQSEQFFPLVYDRGVRKELKKVGYGIPELFLPMYRFFGYQQAIKNGLLEALHLKHYVSFPAYKGHRPENGPWNGTVLREMDTVDVVVSDDRKVLFESFLARCQQDSVLVVMVYSPMYVGAREKLQGLEDVRTYFSKTAKHFGFVYLDYLDDPICQDSTNFCVSVHMNPTATKEFTRMLCRDLDSLSTMN